MAKFPFKAPIPNAPLQDWFEKQMQSEEQRTVVYTMTKGGDTLEEIMPKTHFRDDNEAKAITLGLNDIRQGILPESYKEMIKDYCNALISVEGKSRYEALMGSSGVVDSNYWRSGQEEKKNGHKRRFLKKTDEERDDDE